MGAGNWARDQAFEYWTHIVPRRPPFVILRAFDEFWIYDFDTQLFDPVERLLPRDLPQSGAALAFLLPHPQRPVFGNNRVDVTRKAADIFAEVFRQIVARGQDRARAQHFIFQLLVSVVAEDLGRLPNEIVTPLLAEIVGGKRAVASLDHGNAAHHGIDSAMPSTADSTVPTSDDLLCGIFRQMAEWTLV